MEYKDPTEDEEGREAESERVRRMMMLNRFHLFQDYSRAATGNHENGALLTPISTEKLETPESTTYHVAKLPQNRSMHRGCPKGWADRNSRNVHCNM